jgi:hypothetical protein
MMLLTDLFPFLSMFSMVQCQSQVHILSHMCYPPVSNLFICLKKQKIMALKIFLRNKLQVRKLSHQIQGQNFTTYRYTLLPVNLKSKNGNFFGSLVSKESHPWCRV